MTLTDFLLARIAEDEAGAAAFFDEFPTWSRRLTADCEAKRRIVEDLTRYEWMEPGVASLHDRQLEHLAAVYAGHPDYRPDWK